MEQKNVQRLVGIDFGTSTSLIRVKRYQEDKPVGDNYNVGAVTYGNGAGDSKAVTLVRLNADSTFTCGRYGEEQVEGSTVYREFKMDLESSDVRKQSLARELTGEFFKYLYERYDHQKSDLGQLNDEVRTIISYPAKWKPETRAFMEAVAAQAGFPNVSSMDEPSAALYAVLCRKMDEITQQGLLMTGQSGYVLLIDMGAGTTDLAVCRYKINDADGSLMAADRIKTEIVATWPDQSSDLTFGGREVDRILEDYLIDYLCSCGFDRQIAEKATRGVPGIKAWKEDTVSTQLAKDQTVNTCSVVTQLIQFAPQPKPFPAFDRTAFQQMLAEKIEDFKELVYGCLSNAANIEPELFGKGIDLVVLTGGHSSWYFTSELLDGTMPGIQHPALEKVQREKNRVLRLSNPQETVALGMVYSQLPFQIVPPPDGEDDDNDDENDNDDEDNNDDGDKGPSDQISIGDFICNYRFDSISPVYDGALPQLLQNMNVPSQTTIYSAYDATVFGSYKYGTVFTAEGIYCRSMLSATAFCSWEELAEGLLRFSGGNVFSHNTNTHVEKAIGCFTTMDDKIKAFYRQLKGLAKEEFGEDIAGEESDSLDYSCVQFETVLAQTLNSFNAGTLSYITGKSVPATMRITFRVPAEETIYLTHDDSLLAWLNPGASGTILTGSGIYSKGDGSVIFVSWSEFAAGTLEPTGNDILVALPNGIKKLAGKFALCRPQAIALYLELQNAFRQAAGKKEKVSDPGAAMSPVERFLNSYAWETAGDLFSPAHIPFVRKEAEPHVGNILLAHRSFVYDEGSTIWFWFALGTKGIYTNRKQMITWKEFANQDVRMLLRPNEYLRFADCPGGIIPYTNFGACFVGDVEIPTDLVCTSIAVGFFLQRLQNYLRDPNSPIEQIVQLDEQKIQQMLKIAASEAVTGVLQKYTPNPHFISFLNIAEQTQPLYKWDNGKLGSVFAQAACMGNDGFRSRYFKGGKVQLVPYEALLRAPIWAYSGNLTHFYAGEQFLFHASGNAAQIQQTIDLLRKLQQHLWQ